MKKNRIKSISFSYIRNRTKHKVVLNMKKELIIVWHTKSAKETEKDLKTSIKNGLTDKEIKERKEKYGINKLDEKKKTNIFIRFIQQFNDFMIIILIIASIVSAIPSEPLYL